MHRCTAVLEETIVGKMSALMRPPLPILLTGPLASLMNRIRRIQRMHPRQGNWNFRKF